MDNYKGLNWNRRERIQEELLPMLLGEVKLSQIISDKWHRDNGSSCQKSCQLSSYRCLLLKCLWVQPGPALFAASATVLGHMTVTWIKLCFQLRADIERCSTRISSCTLSSLYDEHPSIIQAGLPILKSQAGNKNQRYSDFSISGPEEEEPSRQWKIFTGKDHQIQTSIRLQFFTHFLLKSRFEDFYGIRGTGVSLPLHRTRREVPTLGPWNEHCHHKNSRPGYSPYSWTLGFV